VFVDASRFDIRRHPNSHVSFGNGPHTCVGAPLARMTMRVLLEEMTRRVGVLRVVNEPDIEANIFARAVKRFDLAVTAR
jgi:cytochrome P450